MRFVVPFGGGARKGGWDLDQKQNASPNGSPQGTMQGANRPDKKPSQSG